MTVDAIRCRDALDVRYKRHDTNQWVVVEEARSGAGFAGNNRQCDYLAINSWQKGGLQIIGHEIKRDKRDWRRELDDPTKAEAFKRFCHRWWLVCPSDLAKEIEHEVPLSWGIIGVTAKTSRVVRAAPLNEEREELPVSWWVGWMAQISRARDGEFDREMRRAMADEREALKKEYERSQNRQFDQWTSDREREIATLDRLREELGIDLRNWYAHDVDRIVRLNELTNALGRMDPMADLKRAKKTMDNLIAHFDAAP